LHWSAEKVFIPVGVIPSSYGELHSDVVSSAFWTMAMIMAFLKCCVWAQARMKHGPNLSPHVSGSGRHGKVAPEDERASKWIFAFGAFLAYATMCFAYDYTRLLPEFDLFGRHQTVGVLMVLGWDIQTILIEPNRGECLVQVHFRPNQPVLPAG